MRYDEVNQKLIMSVPEIKSAYEKECKWYNDQEPGPHNFFGDVVTPLLIDLLNKHDDQEMLLRFFRFFEDMATSEDKKVQEVLAFSVLERIGDDQDLLDKAFRFWGPSTKKLSGQVEEFWGRTKKKQD